MKYDKIKRVIRIRSKGRYKLLLRIHNKILINNFRDLCDWYKTVALYEGVPISVFNENIDKAQELLMEKLLY